MKTLLSSHKKRLENALNEAQHAFWSVIAWLDTNQEEV